MVRVSGLQEQFEAKVITGDTFTRASRALKKDFDDAAKSQTTLTETQQAAKQAFDETRTSAEKYAIELERITKLRRGGDISQDTFERSKQKLDDAQAKEKQDAAEKAKADTKKVEDERKRKAKEAADEFAKGVPKTLSQFGGDKAAQVFGGSNGLIDVVKRQYDVQKKQLDEAKATRKAVEAQKGLVLA